MKLDRARLPILALPVAATLAGPDTARAAMMNRPFAVGGGEGGGGGNGGVTGWLLNEQSLLTHHMASQLRAVSAGHAAIWGLVGLGFAYGVFHAAGPGHGKAVIASYMMANDRAMKRGVVLAFLAAMLQGFVAVTLVGVAALIFNTTASRMNQVADAMAIASYCGITTIGAWLVWRKGRALAQASRRYLARRLVIERGVLFAGAAWRPANSALSPANFRAYDSRGTDLAVDDCGGAHAPDPRQLGEGFSWRGAVATVLAAGARPCSGAILLLVFALAQNLFVVGVAATFAMSLGVALTTGALAFGAVFAKAITIRFAVGEETRIALVARAFEFVAALLVLGFGLALLASSGVSA
jgi:nickel/cobalt exporter